MAYYVAAPVKGRSVLPEIVKDIAAVVKISYETMKYRFYTSQKLFFLAGGHPGLLALLPLDDSNEDSADGDWYDIAPSLTLKEARDIFYHVYAKWGNQDARLRALCALGKEVGDMILTKRGTVPESLKIFTEKDLDFEKMTMKDLDQFLDPWYKRPCQCEALDLTELMEGE